MKESELNNGYKWFAVFIVVVAAACTAQETIQQTFPLAKGTYWVYEDTVRWTIVGSNKVASKAVRWRMEVVETLKGRRFFVARVKGAPWDLGWYEPGRDRGDYLFVVFDNAIFMMHDQDAREIYSAIQRTGVTKQMRERVAEHIWFRLPFHRDARYCDADQESRTDRNYCWVVNSIGSARIAGIAGINAQNYEKVELMYRTMPEHEVLELVPGIGITRWTFQHHGTIAEAHVRLIEFHSS